MLTVALVATLAAGAAWQQWRQVSVERAQRTQQQMAWVLLGALDWARLVLREDANAGTVDHLSEPWALALQEAKLSSFLNLDGRANDAPDIEDAFLSGRITDLQSRLNAFNLIKDKKLSAPDFQAFERLWRLLGLPETELVQLCLQLQASAAGQGALWPQQWQDLRHLGVSAQRLQTLSAWVTWLPARTAVNVNTAAPEVLVAALPGLDLAGAQSLVRQRALAHFKTVDEALRLSPAGGSGGIGGTTQAGNEAVQLGVSSRFFQVHGQLRLGGLMVNQLSILQREGPQIRALSRHQGSLQSQKDVYPDR
jgi:general secretion pathway protein K